MSMCAIYRTIAHFNPRPREEGDATKGYVLPADEISIHALVKRATQALLNANNPLSISIHALVKRATAPLSLPIALCSISIHALVKRATFLMI